MLMVLGMVALALAGVDLSSRQFSPGKNLRRRGRIRRLDIRPFLLAVAYSWIVRQPYFRERVYILGTGDRAQRLLNGLRSDGLGIEVVGWTGDIEGELTRETVATHWSDWRGRRGCIA